MDDNAIPPEELDDDAEDFVDVEETEEERARIQHTNDRNEFIRKVREDLAPRMGHAEVDAKLVELLADYDIEHPL